MSNVKQFTERLDKLDFSRMYEGDFFRTWEKTREELDAVFTVADALRHLRENNISPRIFDSGLGISLFRDNSTRTRFSFASACNLLGLKQQDLDEGKSQIAHGETVRETANMISFMADAIGIRDDMYIGKGNAYMHAVADAVAEGYRAGVLEQKPTLVNLQCDIDHPTQCMADLDHVIHTFGGVENLKGKKVAMTWAYSPSYGKPLSVPQGVIGLFTRFGMDVSLAYPEGYEIMDDVVGVARANAAASGGSLTVGHDMDEAFRGADIVYPKSWAPFAAMQERTERGYGRDPRAGEASSRAERGTQGLGVHGGKDAPYEGRKGALSALPAGGHHRRELRSGRSRRLGVRPLPGSAVQAGVLQALHHRRDDLPGQGEGSRREACRAGGEGDAAQGRLTGRNGSVPRGLAGHLFIDPERAYNLYRSNSGVQGGRA